MHKLMGTLNRGLRHCLTVIRPIVNLLIVFALCHSKEAFGQVTTATVSGKITDNSGAIIPGAEVTVTNVQTAESRKATSATNGSYLVNELQIGEYEIGVQKPGFQALLRKGIVLTVGQSVSLDLSLLVGDVKETITVNGNASQIDSSTSEVSTLIEAKQIRDLPTNGRNFESLILLAPGVQPVTTQSIGSFFGRANSYSVSGQRPEGQAILLDGANIQGFWEHGSGANIIGTSLGIEAIAEFEVLTGTYGAQFGGDGAVINSVTRSGTNTLHGSAYDFLRNSVFDARNYFDPLTGPPSFRRNQFGGTLGGPIVHDRTFFFVNYEGLRQALGETQTGFVPDALARTGVLPTATVVVNPSVIPILALFPLPNGPEIGSGIAQVTSTGTQAGNEDFVSSRVDQTLSTKDSIFGRYVYDNALLNEPFSSGALPGYSEIDKARDQYITLQERRIQNSKLLNLLRFSLVRTNQGGTNGPTHSALQFYPGENRADGTITVPGLTTIGSATQLPFRYVQNKFYYADDVYLSLGNHSIKVGFEFARIQTNAAGPNVLSGSYTFTSLANFLQGKSSIFGGTLPGLDDSYRGFRESRYTSYFQDDWKVNSRLTLNLGLRYTPTNIASGAKNNLNAIINPLTSSGFTPVHNVLAQNPSYHNFDPRFGLAFDASSNHKTVLRAAFGMFHDVIGARTYGPEFFLSPPFNAASINNPSFPNPFVAGATSSALPTLNNAIQYNVHTTPYQMQYNLNVQREIVGSTVLTVGYYGSIGRHLFVQQEANPVVRTFLATGAEYFATSNNRLNNNFASIGTIVPTASSNYNSLQASLAGNPIKSVRLQLNYTFGKFLDNASSTYVLENNAGTRDQQDPYNLAGDYGRSGYDIRHNFTGNVIYALPFHRNLLVSGYEVSSIISAHSGPPFSVDVGYDIANQGNRFDVERPNLVPGRSNNPILGGPARYFDPTAFTPQVVGTFGNLGRNTLVGPNFVTCDFGLHKDTPMKILGDGGALQLRAEVFNALNHANFALPSLNLFSASTGATPLATAGRISSTISTSRQIQLAMKIIF